MNLELEAISSAEGIGIFRDGSLLRLVRPPYQLKDCPVLPEDALQDAILRHGFFAAQETFSSWSEAIEYLNQQVIKTREAMGRQIPEQIPGDDILIVAPNEVIHTFLDRVEQELIPNKLFEHAENFLLALMRSGRLDDQPEMLKRAVNLLSVNKAACAHSKAKKDQMAAHDVRFRSLEQHNQTQFSITVAQRIREQHSIFVPAH